MNKILRAIEAKKNDLPAKEQTVIDLSNRIVKAIGLSEIPDDFEYELRKYKIVSRKRAFTRGWVLIIEIRPIYGGRASWESYGTGTSEVVIPPEKEIEAFFRELKKELES